jgi:trimeric autotransporter adhesin
MKAKSFLLNLALFFFLTASGSLFGQIIGPNTQFYLSRYNFVPGVGKSPVVLGDTLGIMGFRGLLSSGNYQRSAGIYALVTSAPTATGLATRLNFATGSNGLQDRMTILENGFMGINTNTPAYHLHVNGNAFISGDFTVGGNFKVLGDIEAGRDVKAGRDVLAGRNITAAETISGKNLAATDNVTGTNFTASNTISATGSITSLSTVSGLNLNASNNLTVGNRLTIGATTTPTGYRLYVADGILTEKVKVALKSSANWADYVFQADYNLRSLREVETFIQKNGHLPGVPSATEVVKNGIDVATMDAKLLEKIEELTLYLLQLKKDNEALRTDLEALKKQVNK